MRASPILAALSEAQNHRCAYCGTRMVLRGIDKKPKRRAPGMSWRETRANWLLRVATKDHVVPRSMGGGNDRDNLVAACVWCNKYRGNQPAAAAFARVQKRLRRGSHPHVAFAEGRRLQKARNLRTIEAAA
ncbi:HNH endonuclease [Afifella sp. H1R]|uniref:HNH endonuclease n=1 Tax=Afifella sp. H1R TaxID=2908841 RepID=UPI001F46A30B|nr:HNH endonuclease [Afifella sp. H1R]MCF1502934.1 HNH endonuclease [Afifella sp. H1R]